VLDLFFDLVDALDIEPGMFLDLFHRCLRNLFLVRQGFTGMNFDGQPDTEPVFRFPDEGHVRQGIALDQSRILLSIY